MDNFGHLSAVYLHDDCCNVAPSELALLLGSNSSVCGKGFWFMCTVEISWKQRTLFSLYFVRNMCRII